MPLCLRAATPSTTLTIDQLCLSPLNVRTYRPDAEDTVALQASILADGLLNPIAVHAMKGAKGRWGAIAGGRRYRAIKALVGNGAVSPKRLASGTLELPAGDVVAHIGIDANGEPTVSYWWESRKAKFGNEKPKPAAAPAAAATPIPSAIDNPFAAKQRADAAIRQDDGLSQDAIFALRSVRKAVLRAALVDDARSGGGAGVDYLVWAQARALLASARPNGLGMRAIASDNLVGVSHEALEMARQHVAATPAAGITAAAIAEVTFSRASAP